MYCFYDSPIGCLRITSEEDSITGLHFMEEKEMQNEDNVLPDILKQCVSQLNEYFEGTRKMFDLKINNKGSEFRQKVWAELEKISYGQTVTYKEMAERINSPKAVRAVGGANHHNNISIIVPCHRVIGATGELTGYGGGVWRKEWLLNHEKKIKGKDML